MSHVLRLCRPAPPNGGYVSHKNTNYMSKNHEYICLKTQTDYSFQTDSMPKRKHSRPTAAPSACGATHASFIKTRAAHAEISCMSNLWRGGRLRRNAAGNDTTTARSPHTGNCRTSTLTAMICTRATHTGFRTSTWVAHKVMSGRTYRDAAKPRQLRVAPQGAHKE